MPGISSLEQAPVHGHQLKSLRFILGSPPHQRPPAAIRDRPGGVLCSSSCTCQGGGSSPTSVGSDPSGSFSERGRVYLSSRGCQIAGGTIPTRVCRISRLHQIGFLLLRLGLLQLHRSSTRCPRFRDRCVLSFCGRGGRAAALGGSWARGPARRRCDAAPRAVIGPAGRWCARLRSGPGVGMRPAELNRGRLSGRFQGWAGGLNRSAEGLMAG